MDSNDGDLFNYDEYEKIYKCRSCGGEEWRLRTDGSVVCIDCLDEYDIMSFIDEESFPLPPNCL